MKITKAVFPVAGLGTRFLPITKTCPKEMLPIVDKPLIQYAVEEAVDAGIKDLIFITSPNHGKRAIEEHFDSNIELENHLKEQEKFSLLNEIKNIVPSDVNCIYIRQSEAKGLGHAVLCASPMFSKDEYFAVLLADDLIYSSENSCLEQMIEKFNTVNKSILAVEGIEIENSDKYGIVSFCESEHLGNFERINNIIEKPKPDVAPSNFGVVGRYILSSDIFNILREMKPGVGGEIQLTDAIEKLIENDMYALKFSGKRFDCGSKIGYLKATINFALNHSGLKHEFKNYLYELTSDKIYL